MSCFVARKNSASGLALFTYKEFNKGELVFKLGGTVVHEPVQESIRISKGEHIIDSFGSYMNHSCTPNVIITGYDVIAYEYICAGQEVTFDYRTTESTLASPFVCICCGEGITYGYKED